MLAFNPGYNCSVMAIFESAVKTRYSNKIDSRVKTFFSLYVFTAPPSKAVIKERRPSSGGVKPVQQVFYTEWKNETG